MRRGRHAKPSFVSRVRPRIRFRLRVAAAAVVLVADLIAIVTVVATPSPAGTPLSIGPAHMSLGPFDFSLERRQSGSSCWGADERPTRQACPCTSAGPHAVAGSGENGRE